MGKNFETMTDNFLRLQNHCRCDCSNEIKRHLLLGRKATANLDSVLESRVTVLTAKFPIIKAMVFPEVMYGYESWTIKIECQRIDAFKLCWRRFLRVPWIAVRLVQFSSVAQSCLTLWDPMNCSTPGCPVHHQLLELAQTHVHWVGDAIKPSHPLSSPSLPAFNLSQHQGLSDESVLHIRWPKDWSFSFSISPSKFRTYFL